MEATATNRVHVPLQHTVEALKMRQRAASCGSIFAWFWGGFAIVPVLYLLSVGPATTLYLIGGIPGHTYGVLYGPLAVVCDKSPAVQSVVEWYVRLWV
jgi:hypothetical protein